MKPLFLSLTAILLMFSCKQGPKTTETAQEPIAQITSTPEEGKKLLETKCYVCHNPSMGENQQRIAPPMVAVKAHYLDVYPSKEAFVNGIIDFVKSPSQDKSMMRGAVRRFGIMPTQQFPEDEVRKIAEYMYEFRIEEPEWFQDHWMDRRGDSLYNKGNKLEETPKNNGPKEMGMQFATETQKVLGKNLMGTIQRKGVEEAVVFCNERAYPLTDSMATHFNAKIRRVSDKPRNPNNKANKVELAHIDYFKKDLLSGATIEPKWFEKNGKIQFYYPIVTNDMCLNCHGKPEENIVSNVLENIQRLYPTDQAIGYSTNEVRGIWSITFDVPNDSNQ